MSVCLCVQHLRSRSSIRLWKYFLFSSRSFFCLFCFVHFIRTESSWNWFLYKLWRMDHVYFSPMQIASCLSTFCCEVCPFLNVLLWPYVPQMTVLGDLFLDLSSPLTYVPVPATIPYLLHHCSSIISLDFQQPKSYPLLKCVLDDLGTFHRTLLGF